MITTTLTITSPAGAVTTIATSLDPADPDQIAAALAGPTAIEAATVTYGPPTALADDDAGQLALTILYDQPDAFRFESLIVLTVAIDDQPARIVGRGWIDSVTWTKRGDTYRYRIGGVNIIGRAAATKITVGKLPAQDATDRQAAITAGSPIPLWSATVPAIVGVPMAPVDASNTTALDLVRRFLAQAGIGFADACSTEAEDGITIRSRLAGNTLQHAWTDGGWNYDAAAGELVATEVPANRITDAPRSLSRQGMLTQVTISYTPVTGGTYGAETQLIVHAPGGAPASSTAELTIATDLPLATGSSLTPIGWPEAIMADNAAPTPCLDTVTILTHLLDAATVAALIGIPQRSGAVLHVTGAPADVDEWQRVSRATLTIAAGRISLAPELEPARWSGGRPIRFSDFPRPDQLPSPNPYGVVPARFRRMGTVRASQLALVQTPRAYLGNNI